MAPAEAGACGRRTLDELARPWGGCPQHAWAATGKRAVKVRGRLPTVVAIRHTSVVRSTGKGAQRVADCALGLKDAAGFARRSRVRRVCYRRQHCTHSCLAVFGDVGPRSRVYVEASRGAI